MLAGGCPPYFPGFSVKKIKLQGKVEGFETDDLIVSLEKNDRSKEQRKLICQVKRSVSVTKSNKDFSEFLRAAWKDFHNSSMFTQGKDAIALMTGPLSEMDARNVQRMENILRNRLGLLPIWHVSVKSGLLWPHFTKSDR